MANLEELMWQLIQITIASNEKLDKVLEAQLNSGASPSSLPNPDYQALMEPDTIVKKYRIMYVTNRAVIKNEHSADQTDFVHNPKSKSLNWDTRSEAEEYMSTLDKKQYKDPVVITINT